MSQHSATPPARAPENETPETSERSRNTQPEGGHEADTQQGGQQAAPFILYLAGPQYMEALQGLTVWVHHLLLPVYARETTSNSPWCPRWWQHTEAVAYLYGLWMAWQAMTAPNAGLTGPAIWHRDYLQPVMTALRDREGPFAGCKPGAHRPKTPPAIEDLEQPPPA